MKYSELINLPEFSPENTKEERDKLFLTEPPRALVMEYISESEEVYKDIPIQTLEAMMDYFFGALGSSDEIKGASVYNNIVTATVRVHFSAGRVSEGIASGLAASQVVYYESEGVKMNKILSADAHLKTLVPEMVTLAKKNAIKRIANIFGRNLNRSMEVGEVILKAKAEPDQIILRKHKNALKKGDLKVVEEIEQNYNIPS